MSEQEAREAEQRRRQDFRLMAGTFFGLAGVALLAIPIASYSSDYYRWMTAAGLGYAIFLASGLSGGVLGFIFSVPHSNKITTVAKPSEQGPTIASAKTVLVQREPLLRSNSSLERISDWLTTMLVGVGLSQINTIFTRLMQFGEFLKPLDVGSSSGAATIVGRLQYVGPTVLVAGVCFGFLSAYLFTRLRITHLFVDAERELSRHTGEDAPLSPDQTKAIATLAEDAATSVSAKSGASVRALMSTDTPAVRDALSLMTQLLYEKNGYDQAISVGKLLSSTPAVETARFWFLMAAAQGQRYAARNKADAPSEELLAIRQEVLNAIDRTLELDLRYKRNLRNMLEERNVDNDLKSFAGDEEFTAKLS